MSELNEKKCLAEDKKAISRLLNANAMNLFESLIAAFFTYHDLLVHSFLNASHAC